jgi:hypothetical protein
MEDNVFYILMYFSIFIQFLPFFLLLFISNKILQNLRRILLLLCSIHLVSDFLSLFLAPIYKNNNPIYHIFTLLTGVLVLYFYKSLFASKKIALLIQSLMLMFTTISIFLFFYKEGYKFNNTFSNIFLCVLIVLLSLYYFFNMFIEMKVKNLLKHPQFWIASAFLIFYGTTFYLSLFEDFIRSYNNDLCNYIWPIHLISTIIFNLILTKGIWTMRK